MRNRLLIAILLIAGTTLFANAQNTAVRSYHFHLSESAGSFVLSGPEKPADAAGDALRWPAYASCSGSECEMHVGPSGVSAGRRAHRDDGRMDFALRTEKENKVDVICLTGPCEITAGDEGMKRLARGEHITVPAESDLTIFAAE